MEQTWIVYATFAINLAGVVAMVGMRYQTIKDHERRIGNLEDGKVDEELYKSEKVALTVLVGNVDRDARDRDGALERRIERAEKDASDGHKRHDHRLRSLEQIRQWSHPGGGGSNA